MVEHAEIFNFLHKLRQLSYYWENLIKELRIGNTFQRLYIVQN